MILDGLKGSLDPASADFGIVSGAGTVRFERVLPGPVERVWAYLTESDKRAKWLAAGELEEQTAASTFVLYLDVHLLFSFQESREG